MPVVVMSTVAVAPSCPVADADERRGVDNRRRRRLRLREVPVVVPAVDQDDVCVGYRRGVDGRRGEVVRIAVGGDVEGLDCAVGTDDFLGDRPQTLVEVTTSGRMTSVESDPSEHPLRTAVVVMTAAATAADRRRRWRTRDPIRSWWAPTGSHNENGFRKHSAW